MVSMALTLAEVLEAARSRLDRVEPCQLQAEIDKGAVVIDVRDSAQRAAQGDLPGARAIDLTILEWRVAPSSASRVVDVLSGQKVILVCSEGYSSSLAAARLQELGVKGATDLVGGFKAWKRWVSAGGG